jgi:hypothetical protein
MKRLQPRRVTLDALGVCERTVTRWERDAENTGFPAPVEVNGRKYDCPEEIAQWQASRRTARARRDEVVA